MGRILTIRLTVATYDESEVFRAWPKLCSLAWPGQGEVANGVWRRTVLPAALQAPQGVPRQQCGVLELAGALADQARFGAWLPAQKEQLRDGLALLAAAGEALETALGDWQAQAAHKASNAMEDTLDDMERVLE